MALCPDVGAPYPAYHVSHVTVEMHKRLCGHPHAMRLDGSRLFPVFSEPLQGQQSTSVWSLTNSRNIQTLSIASANVSQSVASSKNWDLYNGNMT